MPRPKRLVAVGWILVSVILTGTRAKGEVGGTFRSIALRENVISVVRWNVSAGELLCVFSRQPQNSNQKAAAPPVRSLAVYRRDGVNYIRIFEVKTPDWLLTAFPIGELNGRFFVAWGGGSAYHFTVFAYSAGNVEKVLDVSSRGMPDIVIGSDERESILVTQMEFTDGRYRRSTGKTEVFRWNGTQYDDVGTFPWDKRFEQVAR